MYVEWCFLGLIVTQYVLFKECHNITCNYVSDLFVLTMLCVWSDVVINIQLFFYNWERGLQ